MDARDNGTENPFADTLYSLEWIASAIEAAQRHMQQERESRAAGSAGGAAEERPLVSGDSG